MRDRKKTKRRLNFPEKIEFPAAANKAMSEKNPVASEEKKDEPIIENKVETSLLNMSTEYNPEVESPVLEINSSNPQLPSTDYDTEEYIEEKAPESFSSIIDKTMEEMTKTGKTVDQLFEIPSLSPTRETTPLREATPPRSPSLSSSSSSLPIPPPPIIPPRPSFLQEAQGALRRITARQLIPSKMSAGLGILSAGALTLLGAPVIPVLLTATAISVANETALAFRRNLAAIFLERDKLEYFNLPHTVEEMSARLAGKLANNSTRNYVADIYQHPYSCNPWSQLGRAYQIGRAQADEKAAKITINDTAKKKSCCL